MATSSAVLVEGDREGFLVNVIGIVVVEGDREGSSSDQIFLAIDAFYDEHSIARPVAP